MSNWTEYSLSEVGNIITGYTPPIVNKKQWDGNVSFYSPADFGQHLYCDKTERTISETALQKNRTIPVNSIMVTCIGSTIGKMSLAGNYGITNQQINTVVCDAKFYYLYVYYSLLYNIKKIDALYGVTAIPIVNKQQFSTIKLPIPDYATQQKIAKILSTIDGQIEKTEAIIAKYQAVKQGMLQDLFTRGIDVNTGELRPRHEDAPELYKDSPLGMIPKGWEIVKLGNHAFVTKLAGFEYTLHFNYGIGGEIIVIRALNIKKGKLNLDNVHMIPKVTSLKLQRSRLSEGDIVISYVGTVGEVAVIPNNDLYHLAPNVAKISVDKASINPYFMTQYLNSFGGQKEILKWTASTTQAALSMGNLRELNLILPALAEQKNIQVRIMSIEDMIEAEEMIMNKNIKLKQGLMSDLLSGKVDVTI